MRKIEQQMIHAIRERKNFKSGNTQVIHSDSGKYFKVYLHGNLIANGKNCGEVLWITDAGYQSNTTKSRLNALLRELPTGVNSGIYQRDGLWYVDFDGKTVAWCGSMVVSLLPDATSSMDLEMA